MTRTTMMIIFGSVMTLMTIGVHVYLWKRLVKAPNWSKPWRRGGTIVIALLWASLPVTMSFSRSLPPGWNRSFLDVPFIWMGMMVLLFFVFLGIDFAKLLAKAVKTFSRKPVAAFDPEKRQTVNRITAGGVLLAVGGLGGAGVYRAKHFPRVRTVEVTLGRLPGAFHGFRIVQLTDLHIGNTLDGDWLRGVVNATNALRPDLIVITGDVVDGRVSSIGAEVAALRDLIAPHGVYFVTGNHEYYSGVTAWIRAFESFGIRVLRNTHQKVETDGAAFALLGVDDFNAKRMAPTHGPDLPSAMRGIPSDMETVLLAHQPRAVFEAAEHRIGLILSGHTHGGQMWPITQLVGLQQPYNKGLYRHDARTQIYVSQGTGYWGPPMRIGTENEIAVIRLRSAAVKSETAS